MMGRYLEEQMSILKTNSSVLSQNNCEFQGNLLVYE